MDLRRSLTSLSALLATVAALALSAGAASAATAFQVDASFGDAGITFDRAIPGGRGIKINAVAPRPGGGWVAVGNTDGGENDTFTDYRWAVLVFGADGKLDQRFGSRGRVIDVNPGKLASRLGSVADAVAVQRDGKILVAGIVDNPTKKDQEDYLDAVGGDPECNCFASRGAFLVVRLLTNGKLDRSFGTNGYRQIRGINRSWTENGPHANLRQLVIAPNGQIYVLGDSRFYSNGLMANDKDRNRLLGFRLRRNGSIDRSFANNGRMLAAVGAAGHEVYPRKFEWLKGGGIAVAGSTEAREGKAPQSLHMVTARINTNGRLDRRYNGRGWRELNLAPAKTDVSAVDLDEQGAATLLLQRFRGAAASSGAKIGALAVKLTRSGALSRTYGSDGVVDLTKLIGSNWRIAGGLALMKDGSAAAQVSTGGGAPDYLVPISRGGKLGTPFANVFPRAQAGFDFTSKITGDGTGIVIAGAAPFGNDSDPWRAFIGRLSPLSP